MLKCKYCLEALLKQVQSAYQWEISKIDSKVDRRILVPQTLHHTSLLAQPLDSSGHKKKCYITHFCCCILNSGLLLIITMEIAPITAGFTVLK